MMIGRSASRIVSHHYTEHGAIWKYAIYRIFSTALLLQLEEQLGRQFIQIRPGIRLSGPERLQPGIVVEGEDPSSPNRWAEDGLRPENRVAAGAMRPWHSLGV